MISVIIPAHNEYSNLKELLPLLTAIADPLLVEIIVVLSPSTKDGSETFPERGNIRILRSPKKGRASQMNYGVSEAKGNILAFLHADVRPPVSFFEAMTKTLNAGYKAGFFSYRFDSDKWYLRLNSYFTAKDGIFTGGGDQCLFILRPDFQELGGFDENFVIMEDFDFFSRLKKSKKPYQIIKLNLTVSARKYRYNSYLKVNAVNLYLVVLFRLGVSPKKLKSIYKDLLSLPF